MAAPNYRNYTNWMKSQIKPGKQASKQHRKERAALLLCRLARFVTNSSARRVTDGQTNNQTKIEYSSSTRNTRTYLVYGDRYVPVGR